MGIYAVWGPPQSGKTTLAIDLAFALSAHNQSVLLISTEQYSELSARLNTQIQHENSLAAAYKAKDTLQQIVHKVDDLLFVLAQPAQADVFGEDLTEETAQWVIRQAEMLFDVVLIDCTSHTGSVLSAWGLSSAEKVFMMCGASSTALMWNTAYRRAVDVVEGKTVHIAAEVTESFDYRTLYTVQDIEPDYWLPYFPNADTVQLLKRTLYRSNGKAGKAYTKAIHALCEMLTGKEEDEEDEHFDL
ncbi:MAG: AAA family ATPase [Oscillospiraceae bacterium]|nr:AAA family ATPase [Oscillospiraceae bacterium]